MMSSAGHKVFAAAQKAPARAAPKPALAVPAAPERVEANAAESAGNLQLARGLGAQRFALSSPGDPEEREADLAADAFVARAPLPIGFGVRGAVADIRRVCAACDEPVLARNAEGAAAAPAPRATLHGLGSSRGEPLALGLRRPYERFFSADLSHVRVHTGERPDAWARSIRASAFARGSDLYFGSGRFDAESTQGQRLLAHELAHVIQAGARAPERVLRRDPVGPHGEITQYEPKPFDPGGKGLPLPGVASPPATGETVTINGVTLSENPEQLRFEMLKLGIAEGRWAPTSFLGHVDLFLVDVGKLHCDRRTGDCVGGDTSRESMEKATKLRTKILPVLRGVIATLDAENTSFLEGFKNQAKSNARAALDASEKETKEQAVRYGLTSKQVEEIKTRHGAGREPIEYTTYRTEYGMEAASPAGKELQAAAKILLDRRRKMEDTRVARDSHRHRGHTVGREPFEWDDPEYDVLDKDLAAQEKSYTEVRASLSAQHPALAKFSERDKDSAALQTLAEKGPGPEMAAVIGQKVAEILANIEKVRAGLEDDGEVNIWRLPKLVGLTKAQLGIEADPLKKKLVEDKYKEEQPGLLEALALLVLNIAALALAGVTGGLSLVVAAGVNAVVAAEHVKEYMMQEALVGTNFDKAKALSQDEPSLFWLAVEVVGVFVDIGTAGAAVYNGFKTLAPLAKAAQAAKEGEEAVKAMEALELAAKELKGEEFAANVVGKAQKLRKGESAAVKFAGTTKEEAAALEAVAKARELEAAEGAVKAASGEATISKAGHIFSCTSPCTVAREKFASVLAKDPALEKKLADIEGRAQAAMKAGDKVKAQAIAEEAAAFNRELRGLQIQQTLKALGPKYKILQDAGLDSAAIERVLAHAGNIDHMKGQLLEELLASRVKSMLSTEAGRSALAGERAGAKLEFIEGHRITDANKALLSDGMLVVRDGDRVQVVAVFESKAGRASSRGLRYSYKSMKEMSEEELAVLRMEAIEELREQNKALSRMTSADMEKQFPGRIDGMMQSLSKGEAGQASKSIERLVPAEGAKTTRLLVDGKPVEVTAGRASTKVVGAVPSDVPVTGIVEKLGPKGEKLNSTVMALDITQAELKGLAAELAALLAP